MAAVTAAVSDAGNWRVRLPNVALLAGRNEVPFAGLATRCYWNDVVEMEDGAIAHRPTTVLAPESITLKHPEPQLRRDGLASIDAWYQGSLRAGASLIALGALRQSNHDTLALYLKQTKVHSRVENPNGVVVLDAELPLEIRRLDPGARNDAKVFHLLRAQSQVDLDKPRVGLGSWSDFCPSAALGALESLGCFEEP